MPRYTEEKIKRLCSKAVAAKNENEFKEVIGDLRSALSEHVRMAKDSLQAHGKMLMAHESKKHNVISQKQFWVVRMGS